MSSPSAGFYRDSLCLMKVFHLRNLLSLPMYLVAKELLVRRDNHMLSLVRRYDQTSMHESQFERLFDLIKGLLLSKMCVILQVLLDSTYSIEDAHIHANNAYLEYGLLYDDYKDRKNLIYGEVEFESYVRILQIAIDGLESTSKFVDLGHGCGKAVCITASLHDFKEFVGIELVHKLHEVSVNLVNSFQDAVGMRHIENPKFTLLRGSFLNIASYDWTDADLILANSTCFNERLMSQLTLLLASMKVGARIITFTHELISKYFKTIYKETITVSWGFATVFIAERIYIETIKHYSIASVENSIIDTGADGKVSEDDYIQVTEADIDQYYSNQDNSFFSIETNGSRSNGNAGGNSDAYNDDNSGSDSSDCYILT